MANKKRDTSSLDVLATCLEEQPVPLLTNQFSHDSPDGCDDTTKKTCVTAKKTAATIAIKKRAPSSSNVIDSCKVLNSTKMVSVAVAANKPTSNAPTAVKSKAKKVNIAPKAIKKTSSAFKVAKTILKKKKAVVTKKRQAKKPRPSTARPVAPPTVGFGVSDDNDIPLPHFFARIFAREAAILARQELADSDCPAALPVTCRELATDGLGENTKAAVVDTIVLREVPLIKMMDMDVDMDLDTHSVHQDIEKRLLSDDVIEFNEGLMVEDAVVVDTSMLDVESIGSDVFDFDDEGDDGQPIVHLGNKPRRPSTAKSFDAVLKHMNATSVPTILQCSTGQEFLNSEIRVPVTHGAFELGSENEAMAVEPFTNPSVAALLHGYLHAAAPPDEQPGIAGSEVPATNTAWVTPDNNVRRPMVSTNQDMLMQPLTGDDSTETNVMMTSCLGMNPPPLVRSRHIPLFSEAQMIDPFALEDQVGSMDSIDSEPLPLSYGGDRTNCLLCYLLRGVQSSPDRRQLKSKLMESELAELFHPSAFDESMFFDFVPTMCADDDIPKDSCEQGLDAKFCDLEHDGTLDGTSMVHSEMLPFASCIASV